MHKAAAMFNSTITARLSSGTFCCCCSWSVLHLILIVPIVVIFGDPLNGTAVGIVDPTKVLVICHDGDLICKKQWIVLADHLNVSVVIRTHFLPVALMVGLQGRRVVT